MDKISIVTVTYNCSKDVEKTIKSIISLEYPNFELIVVDGASNDGTVDILKKYQDYFTYFVSEPDNGIYDAMNKGLLKASGDWVFFQNAGDVFDGNDVLDKIFEYDWQGVDVIYGHGRVVTMAGIQDDMPEPFWEMKSRVHGVGIGHQSVFVRTQLAKKHLFNIAFQCCADYAMLANIYYEGETFQYVPISVSICEGRYGFCMRNYFKQLEEEAIVCGLDNSLYFKLKFWKRKLSYFFSRK